MAPMKAPIGTLHYIEKTVYKAQKALVAAKFNGLAVSEQTFDPEKEMKKPEFVAKNPTGKVPFLETDMGVIFTSNAIARYVARVRADTSLYGKCFDDEGAIDTWLEFCTHDVEVPLMTWVYPTMGLMEDAPQVTATAKKDVKQALEALETALKKSEYLIGDFVSLADIALVCALKEGFARVFEPAFRKPFPKTCAWFEKCCKMPQFQGVLGAVKMCEQEAKPIKCEVPAAPAPAKGKKEAASKPAAKPAAAKPAAAKPAAAKPAAAPAAPAGDAEVQVKAVGDKIRVLKEKLKADGLSGKKINEHPEVKALVDQLQSLKSAAEAAPAAPAPAPAGDGDIAAQVQAVGDKIRVLKEKLKADGLSGKKINEHSEVKALVEQLQELKKQLPA